jgi:hypothetical protein
MAYRLTLHGSSISQNSIKMELTRHNLNSPFFHPQPHFRRAVGQRDTAVGSLICIVGLTQAINLQSLQALP